MLGPSIEARLDSVKTTQRRTRLVLVVSTVLSIAILVGSYNAYFSWSREIIGSENWAKAPETTTYSQQKLADDWVKSHTISISLIGVQFSVGDAAVLGSFSLWIVAMWFFYSTRRENHAVGRILRDTHDNENPEIKETVFHSIISNLVFSTITRSDHPIEDLDGKREQYAEPFMMRKPLVFLIYLPAITITFTILCDILSLFAFEPIFREGRMAIGNAILASGGAAVRFGVFIVVAFVLCALTWGRCYRIYEFERATGKVLHQYAKKLSVKTE